MDFNFTKITEIKRVHIRVDWTITVKVKVIVTEIRILIITYQFELVK